MDTAKDKQDAPTSARTLYSRKLGYVNLIASDKDTITCKRIGGTFRWNKHGCLCDETKQDLYCVDETDFSDDDVYNDWNVQTTTLRGLQDGDI